jgi:hypothetical protein
MNERGVQWVDERDWTYRLTFDVSGGVVPARVDPRSQDPRYLGVFLDFTGEGP